MDQNILYNTAWHSSGRLHLQLTGRLNTTSSSLHMMNADAAPPGAVAHLYGSHHATLNVARRSSTSPVRCDPTCRQEHRQCRRAPCQDVSSSIHQAHARHRTSISLPASSPVIGRPPPIQGAVASSRVKITSRTRRHQCLLRSPAAMLWAGRSCDRASGAAAVRRVRCSSRSEPAPPAESVGFAALPPHVHAGNWRDVLIRPTDSELVVLLAIVYRLCANHPASRANSRVVSAQL
jgi:hypothetical protein